VSEPRVENDGSVVEVLPEVKPTKAELAETTPTAGEEGGGFARD
jgi:hypothetical protein